MQQTQNVIDYTEAWKVQTVIQLLLTEPLSYFHWLKGILKLFEQCKIQAQ